MAENSNAEPAGRGPGRPFPKGVSGNPGGRPRIVREVVAAIADAHGLPDSILPVLDALRTRALAGDVHAAKVYLDRILGPVRPRWEEHWDLTEAPDVVVEWIATHL